MEKVQHLWKIINNLSRYDGLQVNSLQAHYVEYCRRLGKMVELPKIIFGAAMMCAHCGAIWDRVDHRVRMKEGRQCSKSLKKLITELKTSDKKPHRTRQTLIKKSLKNQGNKLIITCSVCSINTRINLNKPARLKVQKLNESVQPKVEMAKKQKKRTKDKTAGLKIPFIKSQNDVSPALPINVTKSYKSSPSQIKAKLKVRNLKKLQTIINKSVSTYKKGALHDFIKELC